MDLLVIHPSVIIIKESIFRVSFLQFFRKSKSSKKKYKKKSRVNKNQPSVGSDASVGDVSKVSPRFNPRDRKTIKKVIK